MSGETRGRWTRARPFEATTQRVSDCLRLVERLRGLGCHADLGLRQVEQEIQQFFIGRFS